MKIKLSLLFTALVFLAAMQSAHSHGTVKVTVKEWGITTSKTSTGAGKITFVIKNDGEDDHELEVVRIDDNQDPASFPRAEHKAADDKWVAPRGVGEVEGIKPGTTKKLTVSLKPGRYALICNMVEKESDGTVEAHYNMGMSKLFVVK